MSIAQLSGITFGKFNAEKSLFSPVFKEPDSLLGDDAGDYRDLFQ